MQLKFTSISSVAQSFIVVAACVAAPSVALADTGGVLVWGFNNYGQCNIPASANSGVSAIAGGTYHIIALKDGAVLAWGYNQYGECNIPDSANSGVSAIAGGTSHTIALKDGAVLAWGRNNYGQCTIPASANSGVTSIAGSLYDTIALARDAASYQAEIATLTSQNTALTSENVTLDSENTALTAQLNCGDLNGDGEVNGADVGLVLINHGPCPPPEKAPQFKGARNDSPR